MNYIKEFSSFYRSDQLIKKLNKLDGGNYFQFGFNRKEGILEIDKSFLFLSDFIYEKFKGFKIDVEDFFIKLYNPKIDISIFISELEDDWFFVWIIDGYTGLKLKKITCDQIDGLKKLLSILSDIFNEDLTNESVIIPLNNINSFVENIENINNNNYYEVIDKEEESILNLTSRSSFKKKEDIKEKIKEIFGYNFNLSFGNNTISFKINKGDITEIDVMIRKFEDDWIIVYFYTVINPIKSLRLRKSTYIKCDQEYGLIKFLNDIKQIIEKYKK